MRQTVFFTASCARSDESLQRQHGIIEPHRPPFDSGACDYSLRHWLVRDVNILDPGERREKFDAITCISVLEQIEDQERAMRSMASLLAPDGILVLTTPYSHGGNSNSNHVQSYRRGFDPLAGSSGSR